jgi:hypothetical protein
MIPPSLVNHWCQASRPSPSTSTSHVRRLSAQAQAECLADGAAAAVAADQVAGSELGRANRGGHAVVVLTEAPQPGVQRDLHAEAGQPLTQYLFHPPLRYQQADRVRDVRRSRPPGFRVGLGDHLRASVPAVRQVGSAGGQDLVDHPEVIEHLQRARAQPFAA